MAPTEHRDQNIFEEKLAELQRIIAETGYDDPRVAQGYYELYNRNGLEPKIVKHFEKFFDKLIPAEGIRINNETVPLKESTVLEFGSGPGHVAEVLADRFGKVIAVDKAKAMVDFVNERFGSKGQIIGKQGEFGSRLPLDDNSVEGIVSFNTIDELAPGEEDNFLSEIARVAKPGGIALINRIVNADNLAMRDKFARERESEIKTYDPKYPRHNVFLNSSLESRLKDLLKEREIQPLVEKIDDPSDPRYCVVKITFNKNQTHET